MCLFLCLRPFQLCFVQKILLTTLLFLTLFIQSYFCLIGPFNYTSLHESLLQPGIILCAWMGLKHQLINPISLHTQRVNRPPLCIAHGLLNRFLAVLNMPHNCLQFLHFWHAGPLVVHMIIVTHLSCGGLRARSSLKTQLTKLIL